MKSFVRDQEFNWLYHFIAALFVTVILMYFGIIDVLTDLIGLFVRVIFNIFHSR